MSKVTFVQPRANFNAYGLTMVPLLGAFYLGTTLKREGHDVSVLSEEFKEVYNEKTGKLDEELLCSDVVGFSTMTCTAQRAYLIADALKKARPNVRVIMGGPHATFMVEEALEHADIVVKGEAERVISDVVNSGKETSRVVEGIPVEDLDTLPFPDLGLLRNGNAKFKYISILTSRGCPYDCVFCSVTRMFGKKYRFRSSENVLEELELRISQGFRKFFFSDDNFTADRERIKVLLEECLRRKLNFRWTAEVRVEVAKDTELLKLMSRTNCRLLMIGFESINPETLKLYKKHQGLDDIKYCISRLAKEDIKVHGFFVLGSDADDIDTIERTVRFCRSTKLDTVQFSILFPIPGTKLFEQLSSQGRIFTKDWSLYDGTHVVFEPKKLSAFELQNKVLRAWEKFYTIGKFKWFLMSRYLIRSWKKANKKFLRHFAQFSSVVESRKLMVGDWKNY
ncbi:MAG: B12-binding domain-containing radical SAM protein [bacterium]